MALVALMDFEIWCVSIALACFDLQIVSLINFFAIANPQYGILHSWDVNITFYSENHLHLYLEHLADAFIQSDLQ